MARTYFLTGALGCIGAWVTKAIVERGDTAVIADAGTAQHRLDAVIDPTHRGAVRHQAVDITEEAAVREALESSAASRIIHLAGLQVPACREHPARGAAVNVVGSLNVLQAAADCGVERVVYASSAAVYGTADGSHPDEARVGTPETHYGVFKQANEASARVFHAERGLHSIGIRPLTVYGVGRDQGLTSDPTRAMKAAVVGRPFDIRFSGITDYQFVADTAAAFLACADHGPAGAHVYNLEGEAVDMDRVVTLIKTHRPEARITVGGAPIPIPPSLDGAAIRSALPQLPRTPLEEGIRETVHQFQKLLDEGRLNTDDLA